MRDEHAGSDAALNECAGVLMGNFRAQTAPASTITLGALVSYQTLARSFVRRGCRSARKVIRSWQQF